MKQPPYSDIIHDAPFGYAYHKLITDDNGKAVDYRFIDVNSSFEKITGLLREKVVGKTVGEVLPDILEGDFNWIEFYGEVVKTGGSEVIEQYSKPLDRWYNVHVFSVDKESFSTVFIDVTKEKEESRKRKQSEEMYRLLMNNSLDAILLTVPDGRILAANNAACELFGMTEQEIVSAGRDAIVDTEDPCLKLLLKKREKTGKARGEIRMKRGDGSFFPADISSSVFYNSNGKPRSSMIVRDISRQKEYDKQLLEQKKETELNNERLESLLRITQFTSGSVQELLDFAINEAVELTGSKIGYIYFYNE